MKRLLLYACFQLLYICVNAQAPYLKPSIGLTALPADTASVCYIPTYLGNFDTSGYAVGDTIPNFALYTVNGAEVNIHTVLQNHRPVLLIAGSYTCSEFRGKVADINNMAAFYSGLLEIYIIYTLEAHPDNAICPYMGYIDVGNANQMDNIYYHQPIMYMQRKNMVDTMNAHMAFNPTILIDGPCNEWWSHFGPAPNNAYLIDTNGIVRVKNGWFNHEPDNMWCSIDSFLGTYSGHCDLPAPGTQFSFSLQQDSIATGLPGQVLSIQGMLKNLSATSSVDINIARTVTNLPASWQTAMCTDICLQPYVDTTSIGIAPSDSQDFIFYFYTDSFANSGNMEITFRNPIDTNNIIRQHYYGITSNTQSRLQSQPNNNVILYPNPANEYLTLSFPITKEVSISLLDPGGKVLKEASFRDCNSASLLLSGVKDGLYFLKIRGDNWNADKIISVRH